MGFFKVKSGVLYGLISLISLICKASEVKHDFSFKGRFNLFRHLHVQQECGRGMADRVKII